MDKSDNNYYLYLNKVLAGVDQVELRAWVVRLCHGVPYPLYQSWDVLGYHLQKKPIQTKCHFITAKIKTYKRHFHSAAACLFAFCVENKLI